MALWSVCEILYGISIFFCLIYPLLVVQESYIALEMCSKLLSRECLFKFFYLKGPFLVSLIIPSVLISLWTAKLCAIAP